MKNIEIMTEDKNEKNINGLCIYNHKRCFYKKFYKKSLFDLEVKNYYDNKDNMNFIKMYYKNEAEKIIVYEYIEEIEKIMLHTYLYNSFGEESHNLTPKEVVNIITSNITFMNEYICEDDTLNKRFFKERTNFIDELIERCKYVGYNFIIDGVKVKILDVIEKVKEKMNVTKQIQGILSQGDPIDLNLLLNGKVIDLEIAGKNSLIGETAIFFNNILINGYSYFIKYAKTSYNKYKEDYEKNKNRIDCKIITVNDYNKWIEVKLNLNYPKKNVDIVRGYVEWMNDKMTIQDKKNFMEYFNYYYIFRMIAPKKIIEMEEEDQIVAFAIIAHFYLNPIITLDNDEILKILY